MKNIVLIGIMGSGKTTVGKALATRLKRRFIDADEYLEEKYQMSIPEMFNISEDYFRARETVCTQDFARLDDCIIATGGGVIKRAENIYNLKQNGIVFYLDRPIDQIINDVDTTGRPLLKEGAQKLYRLDEERRSLYESACDVHLINDGSVEDIVEKIMNWMNKEELL